MGTEVQSKMYLPGSYPLRDLNDNTGSGSWSSYQQNNVFGQYHDFFLTRQAIDVNEEHDKQQLRQTILKHESVFRHQLHELHRLYKIQRDMMNEMRNRDVHKHQIAARISQSQSSFYSSGFPLIDDKERHHISSLSSIDLSHGRPSMSGADGIQFQYGPIKENAMHFSYGFNQNGLSLKDCETLESGCKKLQRRFFDLELPAEEYVNDEKELQGVSGVSVGESYVLSRDHEMTHGRAGNSSIQSGVISVCKSDALDPDLYVRKPHGLNNLGGHIKFKEASASVSTNLENIICSKEEMERRFLSSYSHSGFQGLGNKFSQDPRNGKDGGVSFSSLHLETERRQKGWSGYNVGAGQTGSNGGRLHTGFCTEDLATTSNSQQVECRNSSDFSSFLLSDQNKKESHQKKKIFGVEICERNCSASVEASITPIQYPLVPQSKVLNSKASSISSWKKLFSGSGQNMMMVEGHPLASTFSQSNKSSVTLMHNPEAGNKLVFSSNSRSIPTSGAEASYQNELCLRSRLESKESWVCHSSNGFGHLNGISDSSSASERFAQHGPRNTFRDLGPMTDAKFTEAKKVDAVSPNRCQSESISQPASVSINGTRKQNPYGGLAWLKVVPSCNGNSSEERQGSSQMNLDSLQKNSQQFIDKTEMMRKSSFQSFVQDSLSATCAFDAEIWKAEVGECSSNRKIAGFSISEQPRVCKDLPTPSSPSKQSYLASTFDGTKADDSPSTEFGKQHKLEGMMEKGLINHRSDSIHHIDLNSCVVEEGSEEEVQPILSSSGTNLKIEIDLEAPLVETEMDMTCGVDSLDSKLNEPVNWLQDVSTEPHEGLIQVAAEALVAISSSSVPHQVDGCCQESNDSPDDPLHWFADVISSHKGDSQNEVGSVSVDLESVNFEHTFPNEMDYFELMTLNLTDTEVEEYCYKPHVFENSKNEDIMPKRPRRGQARRGRQRKDFQRDVLPTLSSLLKNEVTEDLQTIEGLIKATGGTWQSSLALKNTARSGVGKRRRRSGGYDSPPNLSAVCQPQTQPPKCREVAFDETSLVGWGKRTRRPPRQRCLISSPPLSIK